MIGLSGQDRPAGDREALMKTLSPPRMAAVLASLMATAMAQPAGAQTYPTRTVHLVVSYAPGGTGDIVARLISDKLAAALGQSVVVENRPGASGSIIPAAAPYATLPDMLKDAARKELTFASSGTGTPGHFAGELLKLRTKTSMTHVPYKGAGPALNDLLGGHVDFFFSGFPAAVAQVKAGTLKLLAVSTARRSPAAPDVPTVADASGLADFDLSLWQGIFAPRGTPKDVVARLNAEINTIVTQPDFRARLRDEGADVTPLTVDQFTAFVRAESAKYLQIIWQSGVKPE
jgi:tripartite-type tricarboxylate transporter receptor subunit TctC